MKLRNIPYLPLLAPMILLLSANTTFKSTVSFAGLVSAAPILTHSFHSPQGHLLDPWNNGRVMNGVSEPANDCCSNAQGQRVLNSPKEFQGHIVELSNRWRRLQAPLYKSMVGYVKHEVKRDVLTFMPDELEKESEVEEEQEEEEEEESEEVVEWLQEEYDYERERKEEYE
ncbi:hypothetical protein F5H01DRAFT_361931 [Linnemannia elongata]|nr:hypothetical protein F5H01DRAFT_361931 [Linnemannia elongata]